MTRGRMRNMSGEATDVAAVIPGALRCRNPGAARRARPPNESPQPSHREQPRHPFSATQIDGS
jgi:hypothetical protein